MNGAFVSRALGPALTQPVLHRAPASRFVAVTARRARKIEDGPSEEVLAPAAEPVDPTLSKPTRSRTTRVTAIADEDVLEPSDSIVKPARRTRSKAVDSDGNAGESAEVKPKRTTRKKTADPESEVPSSQDDGASTLEPSAEEATATKPKRASRKKAASAATDDQAASDAIPGKVQQAKPKAARKTTKKAMEVKEPEPVDVVSTRSRRTAPEPVEESTEAPAPPLSAADVAARRRTSTRRSSVRRAQTAQDDVMQDLTNRALLRNDSGNVIGINRAALGMGRKHWYAVAVGAGREKKWADQLTRKLETLEEPLKDPETGEMVRAADVMTLWVPERQDLVMTKKSGQLIPKKVVHKEGWVYLQAPLDEAVIALVEGCYGFQRWRGEEDVVLEDVGSIKLIAPMSEEAVREIREWESAPAPEALDPETVAQMHMERFGPAGGDALGVSERLEEREGATELDESGRLLYRNEDYTGGRHNPSNWYEAAPAVEEEGGEEAEVVRDRRGMEMTFAPDPPPKGDRRGAPRRQQQQQPRWGGEERSQQRWGSEDRQQQQRWDGRGQQQSTWEAPHSRTRGADTGRFQQPQQQSARQPGVRPSTAPLTPVAPLGAAGAPPGARSGASPAAASPSDFDLGRFDGPNGGVDMDNWMELAMRGGEDNVAVASSTASGGPSNSSKKAASKNRFDDSDEFEDYDDDVILGLVGKDDFDDGLDNFDFDLQDDGGGLGSVRQGRGTSKIGSNRTKMQGGAGAGGRFPTSGKSRSGGAAGGALGGEFDDSMLGALDDFGDFGDMGAGGGGFGGFLDDLDWDADGDTLDKSATGRGGGAKRGGAERGAGGKAAGGGGLSDDLFDMGDDADWGYFDNDDGFGGAGDIGDPFSDMDPWAGGGGGGRLSYGAGSRQGGARSGGAGRSSRGGSSAPAGVERGDESFDLDDMSESPAASRPGGQGGEGERASQGYGDGYGYGRQGGSGYGNRGYQGGGRGGGYGGGGDRGYGGGRGGYGGGRGRGGGGRYGYGQQGDRYGGASGGRGGGGGWQDRRGGGRGGGRGIMQDAGEW